MHLRAIAPTSFALVVLAVGSALPDVDGARRAFLAACAIAVAAHLGVHVVTVRALRRAPRPRTAARAGPRVGEQARPVVVLDGDRCPTSVELALLEHQVRAVVSRRGRHRLVTSRDVVVRPPDATWWQLGRRVPSVDAGWPCDAVDPTVLGGVAVVTVGDLVLGLLVDRPLVTPHPSPRTSVPPARLPRPTSPERHP